MTATTADDTTATAEGPAKPTMRGVLHQWAAVVALVAGIVLVASAPTGRAALAGGVFALSLLTLFTVSATYHRVTWSPKARAWMRRADHASIFILIAGTYTPVALLALSPEVATKLLWIAWGGALFGVLQSLFWIQAPKAFTAIVCVLLGWSIVPYFGEVRRALTTTELLLILAGGVAYTLGAVAYAAKRPNLKPGVFGYHELFHAGTIVAAVAHFTAVALLVQRAR
jgi:hemolysin III